MKRVILLFLACMLIASVGMAAEAEPREDIEITIDGKTIDPEVPPRIQDGRTLVPARFVFEPLGVEMGWDGEEEIASGVLGDQRVDMPIDSKEATVNGVTETLDAPAQIFEGRTYIPLRFAGEAFDRKVTWDGETRSITVDEMMLMYTDDRWEEIGEVEFSPDGDTIAVGARELDLYSAAGREVFASGEDMDSGNRPDSSNLNFSQDGSMLATASWGVNFYDAQDLTFIANLHGGNDAGIAISPDEKMLASFPNQLSGEIWLWEMVNDVEIGKVAEFFPDDGMIHEIEFSPCGEYIVGGFRDGYVHFWDVETHELVNTEDSDSHGGNYNLTFSPDGELLAGSDPDLASEIYLLNMEDFSRVGAFEPEGRVNRMQFSPDGTKLAYGLHGGGVEILETEDWTQTYSFEQDDTVRGLSFGPDSRKLAVGADNGNLHLYGYR